jgi:protein tyrosine phosphatase (PTP) superfamily phosphohydrolase (DUF442 family)
MRASSSFAYKKNVRTYALATIAIVVLGSPGSAVAQTYDPQELDQLLRGVQTAAPASSAPLPLESSNQRPSAAKHGSLADRMAGAKSASAAQGLPNVESQPTAQRVPTANLQSAADCVAAPPAQAQLSDASLRQYGSLSRMANFHVVTPQLLRGSQPSASDLVALKAAGIKTIIDLRNEEVIVKEEAQQAQALGLRFVSIPLDVFNPPGEDAIKQFMAIVDRPSAQPVYVHCLHGQDRTGTMIAIYRIERQGWSADEAYREMLACGFRPGFGRLTQAVFAHAARAGRPGKIPNGGDIVSDLQQRWARKHRRQP